MRTEVYSWRLPADLKMLLEREARRRKTSLSAVLDLAAREWLNRSAADDAGDDEQRRLHKQASECLGAFAGSDPRRSEKVRESVRGRLKRRHER